MRSSNGSTPAATLPGLALTLASALALLGTRPGVSSAAQSCSPDTVTRIALGEAMREALVTPAGPYDIRATTNSVRFQSAVLELLIRQALADRPQGGTLLIPHDRLWWEFLSAAGLSAGEEDKAPIGRRLAFEHEQSIQVTYGPLDGIVKRQKSGEAPLIAANVRLEWPDLPSGARKFSFIDTLSVPRLKATNHQVLTFRFLVFSDMTVLDDIEGISGRPLSGLLGTIFKLIGEGNAKFARFSISADGLQVLRTKATKMVSKTVTATINPDGRAQNGVPDSRADLIQMEGRLKQALEIEYYPYRCSA